jgi:plastocyanin
MIRDDESLRGRMKRLRRALFCYLSVCGAVLGQTGPAASNEVTVAVVDDTGAPVRDAVVSFTSPDPALNVAADRGQAVMVQQNKEFAPHILPVRTGAIVRFPNRDEFRHSVYSFSKPKIFQFNLYGGDEEKKEIFDKPGVVALGCNIHDNMLAYIFVLDTDNFAQTGEDGAASFGALQPGRYKVAVWHPRQRAEVPVRDIALVAGQALTASFRLPLKPPSPPRGVPQ